MEDRLTIEEGTFLVKLARKAVKEYLSSAVRIDPPGDTPSRLRKPRGVFVTIETVFEDERGVVRKALRGCIGYPEPIMPLARATIDAAIAAATEDPRFTPMTEDELDRVLFEVSVLTKPVKLSYERPEDLLKLIKVGRDGLIVAAGPFKGLLLPQVPLEYDWDVEEYLSHACIKAGLAPDHWRVSRIDIYTFQAQVFMEIAPNGEVIERLLTPIE